MTTGRFAIGAFMSVLQNWLLSDGEQQRRRLAADAGDRQQHARDHAVAGGPVGDQHDHLPAAARPSAAAASRRLAGTRFSMSSVVRTTTGMTMTARAIAPAQAEKCPMGTTITP